MLARMDSVRFVTSAWSEASARSTRDGSAEAVEASASAIDENFILSGGSDDAVE